MPLTARQLILWGRQETVAALQQDQQLSQRASAGQQWSAALCRARLAKAPRLVQYFEAS